MTARASWKGHLKVGDLACAVGLYTAVSSSDRVSFNIINRRTGHRVERQFVDSETGKPVERGDQVKGYQMENGDYIVIEGDEIAEIMPESDKVLNIKAFIAFDDIDKLYFDHPYYLAPVDEHDEEALSLIARGMRDGKVAALAEAVLFRRIRTLLIRPHDDYIVATMLNFDHEVRSANGLQGYPRHQVRQGNDRACGPYHRHQARQLRTEHVRGSLRGCPRRTGEG
ncbi:Ku protein [Rhizobium leguminosarum]